MLTDGGVPFVPQFCDPCNQPAPWHSRSAYVPPGSSALLARRVEELRSDYDIYERYVREEMADEVLAKKKKRAPRQDLARRVKEFDWPAHKRVAEAVSQEWAYYEAQQREAERLRSLPDRRRQLCRSLLLHASRLALVDASAELQSVLAAYGL